MMLTTPDENAAAEMIGSLALIAVFVAAIVIIGVTLFSQPLPEKIPAVALTITSESGLIGISHNGGDTIRLDDVVIRIDNQEVLPGARVCPDCGDDFSIGDILWVDCSGYPEFPRRVDILSKTAADDHRILATRYLGTPVPA